jgi:hypothetical protein
VGIDEFAMTVKVCGKLEVPSIKPTDGPIWFTLLLIVSATRLVLDSKRTAWQVVSIWTDGSRL